MLNSNINNTINQGGTGATLTMDPVKPILLSMVDLVQENKLVDPDVEYRVFMSILNNFNPADFDPFVQYDIWEKLAGDFPDNWDILDQINVYHEQNGNRVVKVDQGAGSGDERIYYPPFYWNLQLKNFQEQIPVQELLALPDFDLDLVRNINMNNSSRKGY